MAVTKEKIRGGILASALLLGGFTAWRESKESELPTKSAYESAATGIQDIFHEPDRRTTVLDEFGNEIQIAQEGNLVVVQGLSDLTNAELDGIVSIASDVYEECEGEKIFTFGSYQSLHEDVNRPVFGIEVTVFDCIDQFIPEATPVSNS